MRCFSSPGALRIERYGHRHHDDGVAPFGDRGINARSRLPHAYRSYATSFIGTQRRGIHPLLILSSLKEDLRWITLDRLLLRVVTDALNSIQHTLHLVRYNCTRTYAKASMQDTGVPSPLNRDDDHGLFSHSVLGVGGSRSSSFPRKEVIQPHLPVRLPCYDFVPVAAPALGRCLLAVGPRTSRLDNSHDVTGGVYKARVRIHRAMADTRLLATPSS